MNLKLLVVLLACIVTVSKAVTGEIISGRAWQLNYVPHVRYFLENEADYVGLSINYRRQMTPTLHLKNDQGVEIEQIVLTKYKTEELVCI